LNEKRLISLLNIFRAKNKGITSSLKIMAKKVLNGNISITAVIAGTGDKKKRLLKVREKGNKMLRKQNKAKHNNL